MKKLLIASDHAGYEFKEALKAKSNATLVALGFEYEDLGTHNINSVDYPDYAKALHEKMTKDQKNFDSSANHEPIGILICGTGVGISIMANRYKEIRAVLAEGERAVKLAREHNHVNVLCLGARLISVDQASNLVKVFLTSQPDPDERHIKRIKKLNDF